MSAAEEKEFVIKHVFTDFLNATLVDLSGKKENYFNVPWQINITEGASRFYVLLKCLKSGTDNWSIETSLELESPKKIAKASVLKILYSTSSCSYALKIIDKPEDYLVNGNLPIEIRVKINKMTGISEEKLRNFDESTKEFSDVVLIVNDKKFYVLKTYLAAHSTYFKSLFMGNFDESQQSEIELKDINQWDFQNFLEVLYGEPSINEDTVDGILYLADMYDSKTAIRQCEEFFLFKSKQSLKEKFGAAVQYKMDKLKEKCFSEMKTVSDFRAIVPDDPKQFDHSVWKELFLKSLNVH